MKFSTALITFVATFSLAAANPLPAAEAEPAVLVERTTPPPTNKCKQGQTTQCCQKNFVPILGQLIGIGCVAVDLLSGGTCSAQQQLACCSSSGNSVINIGPICPNILVL